MQRTLRTIACVAVLGLAGCTSSAPAPSPSKTPTASPIATAAVQPGPGAEARPGARPGLAVTSAQLGPSGQAIITLAGASWLTTDAGVTWQKFTPKGTPIAGSSVASNGKIVVALTSDGPTPDDQSLAYQWSRDGGRTWTRQKLTPSQRPSTAHITLSSDGSTVAVVVSDRESSDPDAGLIFVGPVGKDLTGRNTPLNEPAVWVGRHLVIAGGALSTQLFASDDLGATWTQSTVAGVKGRPDMEGPDTLYLGNPVVGAAGAVLPVTRRDGLTTSLTLFSTTDGHTFETIDSMQFGGPANGGATAPGSPAGPGAAVFADPTSTKLAWLTGTKLTSGAPKGLPGSPAAISFSDARHGLALIGPAACMSAPSVGLTITVTDPTDSSSSTSVDCRLAMSLFRTADGGHTWSPATRPRA